MTGGPGVLPRWLTALLIAEMAGAILLGILLAAMFLIHSSHASSYDTGVIIVFSALPAIVTIGAAWLAAREWRDGRTRAATVIAALPALIAVPFLMFVVGVV